MSNMKLIGRSKLALILESLFSLDFGKTTHKKYTEAIQCLESAETCLSKIGMEFPDIASYDLQLEKNEWVELPMHSAKGVKSMGIHVGKDYRSILTYYKPHSYIEPHMHSDEYEVVKVIEGKMKDLITGKEFERGDIMIIPKGEVHHIVTEDNECYMFMMFTGNSGNLKLPHREEEEAIGYIPDSDKAA